MEPDEYIEGFFKDIKSQLIETTVGKDRRSARYKDLVVAATWSNDLWDIQLGNHDGDEPIQRRYDPANARSSQAAANYFVDALRRISGEEPFPRAPVTMRNFRSRSSATKTL